MLLNFVNKRLAIVGSTQFRHNHKDAIAAIDSVIEIMAPSLLVSGGALGIDTIAADRADKHNIPKQIYLPTVHRWAGPGGYKERNKLIAENCDVLLRIASIRSSTYGSGWTRDYARQLGRATLSVLLDPNLEDQLCEIYHDGD